MKTSRTDPSAMSMRQLLHMEVEEQSRVLIDNLLSIELEVLADSNLEAMMRAAHSMKGGARIADLLPVVELAHTLEEFFISVRKGEISLQKDMVDLLLQAVDMLGEMARAGVEQDTLSENLRVKGEEIQHALLDIASTVPTAAAIPPTDAGEKLISEAERQSSDENKRQQGESDIERSVRVNAESIDNLMSLVGELCVNVDIVSGIFNQTQRARRQLLEARMSVNTLREQLLLKNEDMSLLQQADEISTRINTCHEFISQNTNTFGRHHSQIERISQRIKHEVLANRMQPFGDIALGLKRLVRGLGQKLGKEVRLEITGDHVGIDRDALERMNAPLTHLIQNAVAHGVEKPEERQKAGKDSTGTIRITAEHRGGLLVLVVADDGRGFEYEKIRSTVVRKKLVGREVAASLHDHELQEFLFLPHFTLSDGVDDVSGRGVGLDLVRHTLQELRGTIQVVSQKGKGTRFEITLPVMLVVVRCLVFEISGALYGLSVNHIDQVVKADVQRLQSLENRQYISLNNGKIGLVQGAELLELQAGEQQQTEASVIILGKGPERYGMVVDKILTEKNLVETPLDKRFGTIRNVASVSTIDDGSVVVILNGEDLLQSIESRSRDHVFRKVDTKQHDAADELRKRVLVVDDSITVREVERGLLRSEGYHVDAAVDGAEGWNALRVGNYDLVVTDIDMPRMNGIELIKLIRSDPRLMELPIIIVSYKDRNKDRISGMEAGADRYLTKGSFQDDTFVQTVSDLIGGPLQ